MKALFWLAVAFVRAGLAQPGNPVRTIRQLATLARWGTTLAGEFAQAAAREPGRTAILDEDGALTYREVDERTNRLAAALLAPARPSRAGLLCRNHRGLVESLVACGKLGVDVVLLNTGMGTAHLLDVLEEQEIDLLIADAEFDELLDKAPIRTIVAEALESMMAGSDPAKVSPPAKPGRIVILSSGTTGRPKGARRSPKPGLKSLAAMLSRVPLRVNQTVLIEAPVFHTLGYGGLQLSAALRATIVLNRRFDPEQTLRTIAEHRCTVMYAVPVMLRRMLEPPPGRHDTSSLEIVVVSGSALPGELATQFMDACGDVLYNLYGSTEVSWVTIASPAELRASVTTAGRPPRGTRVAIVDDDGQLVPAGTTGRIFALNELPFEGYTNGTAVEVLDEMLALGDVGHLDGDGLLYVDGRADDMIISGGENLFPSQVENLIASMPDVREVVVIGVPDEEFGERLAAYVVPVAGAELDADEIRAGVRERLARYAVPRDVHFLEELPRNATGKVLKRELPGVSG